MELENRIAIVTGGANGIGRGISLVLGERGANVVVADIDEHAASSVAVEVEEMGGQALGLATDVTDPRSAEDMIANTLTLYGRVDILVNNAGVGGAPDFWRRATPSEADWDAAYAVNVLGIVHCIEAVEEHMKARQSGKIVNVASSAARIGRPGFAHYSASKASALNVSQAFALRLAPFSINVNCICPGLIWTPLWDKIARQRIARDHPGEDLSPREYFRRMVQRSTPLGREQTPQDVGKLAAFLCSERARNITGQAINLNGGSVMN